MPLIPGKLPLECGNCGATYQIDPAGDLAGAACESCGGTRFFRSQVPGTESDGTLRNMVDSISQKDQGGNPLGEGTIMGNDGERPGGKRDNYMHSKRADSGTQRVMGTLNTEPYAPLWDESYIKTAGPVAELAAPLLEDAGPAIAGGLRKILPGAIGHLMNGIFGGGGGQQAGGMAPQGPDPAPSMETLSSTDIPFLLLADMDTPQSVKSVGEQHDDPEDQDQKEFNDGDKSPSNMKNPNNEDSGIDGEDGVRQDTPGFGFGENSPAIERAMMILPLLLHHFETGDGQSDPLIRGLHDALENESPGYLENLHPDGEKYVQIIMQNHKQPKGVHAGVNAFPSGLPEVPSTGTGVQAPGQAGGRCAVCGGTLAGDGSCPQCGAKQNPQGGMTPGSGDVPTGGTSYPPSQMLANTQGPVTQEQKQVLHDAIETKPYLFGDILNQIQNQPNTPPLVDPSQAQPTPAPMQPMQGAPGAMPVNDPTAMGGGGGMPMQPMAHTADVYDQNSPWPQELPGPNTQRMFHHLGPGEGQTDDPLQLSPCPKCGQKTLTPYNGICQNQQCGFIMPQDHQEVGLEQHDPHGAFTDDHMNVIPEYLQHMQPHWGKQADAHNAVPRCPDCGSASTTIEAIGDNAGDGSYNTMARCHSCQKTFSLNGEKQSRVILTDLANPVLMDAAEQHSTRPEDGQDPSLTWQDKNGQPIQVGSVYELYTPEMPVPDMVKVVAKKPDALELKVVGEFSNIPGTENQPDIVLTPQKMQSHGYQLVPASGPEAGGEQPLGGMPGMEQIPQSPPTTDETGNSYPNPGTVSHILASDEPEDNDELCHKCGYTHIVHTASSATTMMHECYRCGTAWETHDNFEGREASVALDWLYSDSPHDNFYVEMERAQQMRDYNGQSRSLSAVAAKDERLQIIKDRLDQNKMTREAGRHFTPKEQRALINERGTARNADLLDLSNTHYETRYDPSGKANGMNAPDSHLILGL